MSKQTITVDASWQDVSRAKVYAKVQERAFCGSDCYTSSYLYELKAWGPEPILYQDIGLRVFDGTEIISIAVELLGTLTSPLRIAKNGVTYGIVLVDPSDPDASGIRIQTSSGIRALREI